MLLLAVHSTSSWTEIHHVFILPTSRYSERQADHWFAADKEESSISSSESPLVPSTTSSMVLINASCDYFQQSPLYNKEERLKQFDILLSQTERNAKATANSAFTDHHSADQGGGDSTKVRMMRSTITKHVVEKATINGTGNTFTPALISSTLSMTRLKF